MKYSNINELDQRVEKIVDQIVKHYYTDWKNYDRPKYMKFKGSTDKADKELILIARECGTYLIRIADIKAEDDWAVTLYNYFQEQEHGNYFYIDLSKLEAVKINPATFLKTA